MLFLAAVKLHLPTSEKHCPIIYDVMVECQCVLKRCGHGLYNDINSKTVEIFFGFNGLFVKIFFS